MVLACRAKVSVVGDVTREQADALVGGLFAHVGAGSAAGPCPALEPVPEVAKLQGPGVVRAIPFESAQAHVLIGQPGIRRNDPDFLALTVGNYVLGGGGFVSRLYSEVREKRGLSYSVYSYFAPALHAGAFTVGLQTRPDQAAQAIALSRDVVARFVRDGPTEQELQAAKSNLVGGFALRLDSNRKAARQRGQHRVERSAIELSRYLDPGRGGYHGCRRESGVCARAASRDHGDGGRGWARRWILMAAVRP
jgi:zinc protease